MHRAVWTITYTSLWVVTRLNKDECNYCRNTGWSCWVSVIAWPSAAAYWATSYWSADCSRDSVKIKSAAVRQEQRCAGDINLGGYALWYDPSTFTSSITLHHRPSRSLKRRVFNLNTFVRACAAEPERQTSLARFPETCYAPSSLDFRVVTWLENYMPYRDRTAAAARCYGRYYKRPDDKIGDRGVRAGAGVPILTPVRSSRLESRDGVTWVGVRGR